MKKVQKALAIAVITLPALLGATNSYAHNDCFAKFKIVNEWKAKNNGTQCEIKVKKVAIAGDKGSWDENLTNKKLMYGQSYTTSSQRLNKLSNGKTGSFTLHFDQKCHIGGNWLARTHGPFNYTCSAYTEYKTDIFKFTVKR